MSDVNSYDRQQVFAMLPEGVGELNCQVLPQFLNDARDAELTGRLPRPRRAPTDAREQAGGDSSVGVVVSTRRIHKRILRKTRFLKKSRFPAPFWQKLQKWNRYGKYHIVILHSGQIVSIKTALATGFDTTTYVCASVYE